MTTALVTRPQWKFKRQPRLKQALLRFQNDQVRSAQDMQEDFGMPSQNPTHFIVNSYVSSSPSPSPFAVSKPSTLVRPSFSYRHLTLLVVTSTAAYWTWKLATLKHKPSIEEDAVSEAAYIAGIGK